MSKRFICFEDVRDGNVRVTMNTTRWSELEAYISQKFAKKKKEGARN